MASSAQLVKVGYSTQIAEALAIKRGLQLARDVGLLSCSIESNAQVGVNLIKLPGTPCSEVGLIIKDIKLLLEEIPNCVVDFASRTSNIAVQMLAKLGLSVDTDMFWLEECPP
ncbi:hypothetical protein Q3G72_017938 [Acer saccharum]|nr:hypothetical protein Q3G72_017938 [Acer saccharum]